MGSLKRLRLMGIVSCWVNGWVFLFWLLMRRMLWVVVWLWF